MSDAILTSLDRDEITRVAVSRLQGHLRQFWGANADQRLAVDVALVAERWSRSSAIGDLIAASGDLEAIGHVLGAVEYAEMMDFYNRQRKQPIESFDPVTPAPSRQLSHEAAVLEQATKILSPSDLAKSVERQAHVRRALVKNRERVLKGVYHVRFPDRRQPGPLRVIGEAVEEVIARIPRAERDRLAARLYLELVEGDTRPSKIEATTQRLREQLKGARRAKKDAQPARRPPIVPG